MTRNDFRKLFKCAGPVILPVIHVLNRNQAIANVRIAIGEGAPGVFLINHDFGHEELLPIIKDVRARCSWLWLGVNFLAVTGKDAFPILGQLAREDCPVDAYWADDARIDERVSRQSEAEEIDTIRGSSGWDGIYFGGTAFKKQREVAPAAYGAAATLACAHMDVVTTSGVATGQAADLSKIRMFREACGDHALGIASGVTVANIDQYAPLVDAILVATGINLNGDFYNIDKDKLAAMLRRARGTGIREG